MKHVLILGSVIALQACGGGGTADPIAGPCLHTYVEPIVLIDAVTAAGSGEPLTQVTLTDLALDGRPIDSQSALVGATSLERVDGGLRCTLPCGFGNADGTYSFVLAAPGFAPLPASAPARYAQNVGGCPSSSSGGTHVTYALGRP